MKLSGSFKDMTLSQQFTLTAALALLTIMLVTGFSTSRHISQTLLQANADANALVMESFLQPHIQSVSGNTALPKESINALDKMTGSPVFRQRVLSVKVWRPDGRLIYNSDAAVDETRYEAPDLQMALRGEVHGLVEESGGDDHAMASSLRDRELFETYAPLRARTGEIVAVGEFYQDADILSRVVNSAVLANWVLIGGSTLAIFAALYLIVYRGSETIERQQQQLTDALANQIELRKTNDGLNEQVKDALRKSEETTEKLLRQAGAELHDGPAQQLTYISLQLNQLKELRAGGAAAASQFGERLRDIQNSAEDALGSLRALSARLFMPEVLESGNIVEALQSVINRHEKMSGKTASLIYEDETSIPAPDDVVIGLMRVVQEALNNATRHANGTKLEVSVVQDRNEIVVTTSNEGPAIHDRWECGSTSRRRLGLVGMKFRMEAMGGTLDIVRPSDSKTSIVCRLPTSSLKTSRGQMSVRTGGI